LIPQMILSGLMFPFDKINEVIGNKGKVPIVADLMASRWAYEAMAVYQFKHNSYQDPLFELDKRSSQAHFRSVYLADELLRRAKFVSENREAKNDSMRQVADRQLALIRHSLRNEPYRDIDLAGDRSLAGATPATHSQL